MGVIHCFRNTGSSGLPLTILNKSKGPTCDSDIMNDSNKASPGMFLWSGVRFFVGGPDWTERCDLGKGTHSYPDRKARSPSPSLSSALGAFVTVHRALATLQKNALTENSHRTRPNPLQHNCQSTEINLARLKLFFLKSPTFKLKSNEVCGI